MLKFTEITEISKRDLVTLTDSQLRNIEIRAFWAGLNCSTKKYTEKILIIAEIYNISPDTVKNIVPGTVSVNVSHMSRAKHEENYE